MLSYGPLQTPALFLALHFEETERKLKSEHKPKGRVVALVTSASTGDLRVHSRPMALDDARSEWEKCQKAMKGSGAGGSAEGTASGSATTLRVTEVTTKLEPGFQRPLPLNTTTLFKLAATQLGLLPHETMALAERLYLKRRISYPRTLSRVYTEGVERLTRRVRVIADEYPDQELAAYARNLLTFGLTPPRTDGDNVSDHDPITPEASIGRHGRVAQDGQEEELYNLIVRYYLATLSPDFVMEATTVEMKLVDLPFEGSFHIQHRWCRERGWIEVLPLDRALALEEDGSRASRARDLGPGDCLTVLGFGVEEEPARPHRPLTCSQLVHLMEVQGIGSDASIHEHIEKLLSRKYLSTSTQHHLVFDPSRFLRELEWGWHQAQSGEHELDVRPQRGATATTLKVTEKGAAIVLWLWHQQPEMVKPTVEAKIQEDILSIAYAGRDAQEVLRDSLQQYRRYFQQVAPKLHEDSGEYQGHELLSSLCSPARSSEDTKRLRSLVEQVSLHEMAARRAALMAMYQPQQFSERDPGHSRWTERECAQSEPALSTIRLCLPDAVVLDDRQQALQVSDLRQGIQLVSVLVSGVTVSDGRCFHGHMDAMKLEYAVNTGPQYELCLPSNHFLPVLRLGLRKMFVDAALARQVVKELERLDRDLLPRKKLEDVVLDLLKNHHLMQVHLTDQPRDTTWPRVLHMW